MLMRGHALVWHSQMPSWFFKESEDSSKEVSSEGLLERMKEHITTVASRYAGKVYAWDVVNEVMADGISENGLRRDNENSKWARIIGDLDGDGDDDDYIEAAFRAAREADPNAKLIINEYGAESAGRKQDALYNLIERLLIAGVPVDGVGLQMHISMYNPDVKSIDCLLYTSYPNDYEELFETMVREWREIWNDEELPFLYVQLANYLDVYKRQV